MKETLKTGDAIRFFMNKKNMTIRDVSRVTGKQDSYIYSCVLKNKNLEMSTICLLAKSLGVNASDIIKKAEELTK